MSKTSTVRVGSVKIGAGHPLVLGKNRSPPLLPLIQCVGRHTHDEPVSQGRGALDHVEVSDMEDVEGSEGEHGPGHGTGSFHPVDQELNSTCRAAGGAPRPRHDVRRPRRYSLALVAESGAAAESRRVEVAVSKPSDEPGPRGIEDRLRVIEERLSAVEDALKATSSPDLKGRVGRAMRRGGGLEQRLAEVEAELQEGRRLNMRLAELTDIVQELLVPLAQQDKELLTDRLRRYSASL